MKILQGTMRRKLGGIFHEAARGLETDSGESPLSIGITLWGGEQGPEEMLKGAEEAQRKFPHLKIVGIGPQLSTDIPIIPADSEQQQHDRMEESIQEGHIHACVTMQYNFPVGVSTVARVQAPANGKTMLLACTTGVSAAHRVEAMVMNTFYGLAVARALGFSQKRVGFINVEGSRTVERKIRNLTARGYSMNWARSGRPPHEVIMRGNDLLMGSADVMVTDSLTGNLIIKLLSSFNSGGHREVQGEGYGIGVGPNFNRVIAILSRASRASVAVRAIAFAAEMAQKNVLYLLEEELQKAQKAGWQEIPQKATSEVREDQNLPEKKVDTEIPGLDIMDLEQARQEIGKAGIYAETGMGCTGPVLMVGKEEEERVREILQEKGFFEA